jgi:hypothetical protein
MIYGDSDFNLTLVRIMRENYRHANYEKTVALAKEMSVHIYGDKPVDLLSRVRPGEDDEIKQYRLANWEPTTKAPAGKAIKVVSKIFNPNLMSIIFPDNDGAKELERYTMFYYPVSNSLVIYNKEVTLKKMLADANALMVVKPQRVPRNDAENINPVVLIFGSSTVWNYDIDHFLVNTQVEEISGGKYFTFEYYDTQWYRKIRARSPKETELEIEILEEYNHNFIDERGNPEIPAWFLRGNVLSLETGDFIYESFFADAKAHWNLAIIHEDDVKASFIKHLHPQRYILAEECRNSIEWEGQKYHCNGGIIRYPKYPNGISCSTCNGTGKIANSPYEDHLISRDKLNMENFSIDKSVGYVQVPIDATKLLEERAERMIQKGSSAINMDVEDKVGEIQSGVAKTIDRSGQYDMLYDIASVMFDVHFENQYYFINKYKNGVRDQSARKNTEDNLPQINKPTRFNVEGITELMANYKFGKDSGVDRNFLQAKMLEILNRDFDTNPTLKMYYTALINLDPLFGLTQDELDANLMKGTIRKTDVIIHLNTKSFVDQAIASDKNFLTLDKMQQVEALQVLAEELEKSEEPEITPEMIGTGNTSGEN